jgi:hypothetical protein
MQNIHVQLIQSKPSFAWMFMISDACTVFRRLNAPTLISTPPGIFMEIYMIIFNE